MAENTPPHVPDPGPAMPLISSALATCDKDAFAVPVLAFVPDPTGRAPLTVAAPFYPNRDDAADLRNFFGKEQPHDFAAIASRVAWSPRADEERAKAWLFVAATPEAGFCFVRRDGLDAQWFRLVGPQVPQIAKEFARRLAGCLKGKPFAPVFYDADPHFAEVELGFERPPNEMVDNFVRDAQEACKREAPSNQMLCSVETTTGDLRLLALDGMGAPSTDAVDQFFQGHRGLAGIATRTTYARMPDEEMEPAWLLVVVPPGRDAVITVSRERESVWWVIPNDEAPWFALSTAGSLRKSLGGKPLNLRFADDERLQSPPRAEPNPPVDEDGNL